MREMNGAKWWKFDFHAHTPASDDYGRGDEALKNITPREWLLEFMAKQIDCVAVSDHDTAGWVDELKHEIDRMSAECIPGFRPLHIFPSIELEVFGSVHLLAIFDPSISSTKLAEIIGFIKNGGTPKTLPEAISSITHQNGIAIPAHVDDAKGLFTIYGIEGQGSTLNDILNCTDLIAIEQIDKEYEKPQLYIDKKLSLAEVVGSDSHIPGDVGRRFTWVKMEYPNIEALRLALHDGEDGILRYDCCNYNPNDIQRRYFINSLIIENGTKVGRGNRPLEIKFSPWMTTIIGGRGSGKSSVLEYLRLAFDCKDNMPEKIRSGFSDFAQVTTERGKKGMLLPNTKIIIEVFKDGRNKKIVWENFSWEEFTRNETGQWVKDNFVGNIKERYPIYIFSQKQLYEITEDPKSLINVIDALFDKGAWVTKRNELQMQWMESRAKEREIQKLLQTEDNINATLNDINVKIKMFESSQYQETLSMYKFHQQTNSKLNEINSTINLDFDSIMKILLGIHEIEKNIDVIQELDDESKKALGALFDEWLSIKNEITEISAKVKRFQSKWSQTFVHIPYRKIYDDCMISYAKLRETMAETGIADIEQFSLHIEKKSSLEKELRRIIEFKDKLREQSQISQRILAEIDEHENTLRLLRREVISTLNNEQIRIILNTMGDIDDGEASFRNTIRKPNSEFTRDIANYDDSQSLSSGIIFEISQEKDHSRCWEIRREHVARIAFATPEERLRNYSKPFCNHIESLFQKTPEDVDRLLSWYPEDSIELKLLNNGREQDIETGSAGQRTAGILSLLITLTKFPLVLDQPEDDLDTRLISNLVVNGLRKLKNSQQVIVITHNPNIPVNGAAEQIVEMNFTNGQIYCKSSGALQNNDIRTAVCEIMEGGRDALKKRYYRISKALVN